MGDEWTQQDATLYFLIVLFVIFWMYSLIWVAKDISWRTNSFSFQLLCISVIVLGSPLVGLPIYFLIRPAQRLDIITPKKNTITGYIHCLECNSIELSSQHFCTQCGERLQKACAHCGDYFPAYYNVCPSCGLQ